MSWLARSQKPDKGCHDTVALRFWSRARPDPQPSKLTLDKRGRAGGGHPRNRGLLLEQRGEALAKCGSALGWDLAGLLGVSAMFPALTLHMARALHVVGMGILTDVNLRPMGGAPRPVEGPRAGAAMMIALVPGLGNPLASFGSAGRQAGGIVPASLDRGLFPSAQLASHCR